MKKLLPALLLGSIALAACAAPYPDDYYDDYYYDRYERDYDRYDDYRYRDGKYYDDDYIEAFKNGREYDIVFSWPDLRIISERIDY